MALDDRAVKRGVARGTSTRRSALPLLFVGLFSLTLLSVGLGTPGLYDYDEGMYAEIAREMVATGHWLVPRFDGVPYLEKPPLIYWMTAASFRAFGRSAGTARLPIALAGVVGGLAVFALVRRWGDSRGAVYAALSLATAFGYFLYSRILMLDVPLTAFLTLTLLASSIAFHAPRRRTAAFALACTGAGFATMVKGLVGVVFPIAILAACRVFAKVWTPAGRTAWLVGAACFAAVVLPWRAAVEFLQPGFLHFYVWKGQILRYLSTPGALDVSPLGLFPYLATTAIWFFPWVAFLPQAVAAGVRDLRNGVADRDLVIMAFAWAGVVIGFFALSPARLGTYSIPALPGLAILVGRWWAREAFPSRGIRNGFVAIFLIGSASAVLLWLSSRHDFTFVLRVHAMIDEDYRNSLMGKHMDCNAATLPALGELLPLMLVVAAALCAGGAVGIWTNARGWRRGTFAVIVLTSVLFLTQVHRGLAIFEPHRSVAPLAKRVASMAKDGDAVAVVGPYEKYSSLAFYTGRRVYVVNGWEGDLRYGRLADPASSPYFLDRAGLEKLWTSGRRVFLVADDCPGEPEGPIAPAPRHTLGTLPGRTLYSNEP